MLTNDRPVADFFEEVVKAGGEPKRVCNLLTQVGLKLANARGMHITELGPKAADIAQLAQMSQTGEISATAANTILEEMVKTGKGPRELAEQLNLIQKSDAGELEAIVDEVLKSNPQAAADFKEGGKKAARQRASCLAR